VGKQIPASSISEKSLCLVSIDPVIPFTSCWGMLTRYERRVKVLNGGCSIFAAPGSDAWISYNDQGSMNLFMLRHASAGTGTTDPEVDRNPTR
jgi:hypothetical protein